MAQNPTKFVESTVYPIYGMIETETSKNCGRFEIMRQSYINDPIANPEILTGKLVWFTSENGYSYNHPYSRAKETANKIVKALNKSPEREKLELHAVELLEALNNLVAIQKEFGRDSSNRMILRIELEDWELILKAIKKATQND